MNSSNLAGNELHLPSILNVSIHEDMMEVFLSDGRSLQVPLGWYPRLANATKTQLEKFEISPGGYGVHWPEIDEDLSVKGFLLP